MRVSELVGAKLVTELEAVATVMLAALLLAGSVIDARSLRLPDWVTLPLVALGLVVSGISGGWIGLASSALGAAAGFAALWAIGEIYFRTGGLEGLGLGDAKLLAAAGAWLGPLLLAPVVLVAAVLALSFVAAMWVAGRRPGAQSAVPFGPFLSIGFASLWGARLAGWA
jgi:leader peptidase (prepilin peptidase) / N-methyltransferase